MALWLWLGLGCGISLLLYVLRGWQLSGVGVRGLVDLLRAPFFVLWKVLLMLRRARIGGVGAHQAGTVLSDRRRRHFAFARLLSSAVVSQALLSAASFAIGLMLIRRTSDLQYGYYILASSAILLLVSLQNAFFNPPLAIRMVRLDRAGARRTCRRSVSRAVPAPARARRHCRCHRSRSVVRPARWTPIPGRWCSPR